MTNKILIIGLGKMGSAIYSCLSKVMGEKNIIVCDKDKAKADRLNNIHFSQDVNAAIKESSIIIFAVKPQSFVSLIDQINVDLSNKLIISIMAGISLEVLEKKTKAKRIIRAMPNLPIIAASGFTAWVVSKKILAENINIANKIFAAMGMHMQLADETMMDAVTAISGSGPAYFFYFCELLQKKAQTYGFSKEDSKKIAQAVFIGTARLLEKNGRTAEEWRQAVTSPGGTTEAALNHFASQEFDKIFFDAIDKAKKRSKELNNY